MINVTIPTVGESITEVTLTKWLKKNGDFVKRDEVIAEVESEKASFEISAEDAGVLSIKVEQDQTLNIGDLIATIDSSAKATAPNAQNAVASPQKASEETIKISIPVVGESITEVTLTKWLKKSGDAVRRDEAIAEVESEKASFEINAEKSGILSAFAKDGDVLNIGDLIGEIKVADISEIAPTTKPTSPEKAPQAPPSKTEKAVASTPLAKAIIEEKKLDASQLHPTPPFPKNHSKRCP